MTTGTSTFGIHPQLGNQSLSRQVPQSCVSADEVKSESARPDADSVCPYWRAERYAWSESMSIVEVAACRWQNQLARLLRMPAPRHPDGTIYSLSSKTFHRSRMGFCFF